MRIVIDTNIIVSALLSNSGKAYRFLSDVFDNEYDVIVSEEILKEYSDVLMRKKFDFSITYVKYILKWFKTNAIKIETNKSTIKMHDEKDRVFYDVAKAYKAKLVTGNMKHFPVDELVTSLNEMVR